MQPDAGTEADRDLRQLRHERVVRGRGRRREVREGVGEAARLAQAAQGPRRAVHAAAVRDVEGPAATRAERNKIAATLRAGDPRGGRRIAGHRFADLFSLRWPHESSESAPRFTDNGMHLTEAGYAATDPELPHVARPVVGRRRPEEVRRRADCRAAKNQLFFYRWRPQNETYLFGFRKHEQGKNAKEIAEFDPLVDKAEEEIRRPPHQVNSLHTRHHHALLSPPLASTLLVPSLAFAQANAKMPGPGPGTRAEDVHRRARVRGQPVRRRPAAGEADPDELRPAGPAVGGVERDLPADQARARRRTTRSSSSKTPTATARPTRRPSSPTGCSSRPASSPATAGRTSPTAPNSSTCRASKPAARPTSARVLLSGFGTEDTHHIIHTFRWGPDGRLYFNQSIYIHSHIETPHGVKRLNARRHLAVPPGDDRARRVRPRVGQPVGPRVRQVRPVVRDRRRRRRGHQPRRPRRATTSRPSGPHARIAARPEPRQPEVLRPGSASAAGTCPTTGRATCITNDFRGHRVCRFKLQDDGSDVRSRAR